MTAGVVFDVAADVRLRPIRKGHRPLLGPGLTTLLSGSTASTIMEIQELTAAWEDLSGGGRTSRFDPALDSRDTTAFGQQAHLDRLTALHRVPVTRAVRPILAEPAPVDPRRVRHELRSAAVEHVMALRVPTRRRLQRAADQRVSEEVARRIELRALAHSQDQAEADQWWQHLCDGHAKFSFSRLVTAFDGSDLPAAVTAVADRTAHVVMSIDTAEMLIGQREPSRAGASGLSLAIMNESRRNKLYLKAMCAGMVAVAAHTFAVAPGIDTVNVATVGLTQPTGPCVLAMAAMPRSAVLPAGKDRPAIDDLFLEAQRGTLRLALERTSVDDAPQPLDERLPSVQAVLDAIDLGWSEPTAQRTKHDRL